MEHSESIKYYALLKQNSSVRQIWLAQVVSELGDWFNLVALMALIAKSSNKAQTTGLLLIIQMVPFIVLSPIAGFVADRFDRRKVMIATDLLRALVVFSFVFLKEEKYLPIIYALSATQFVLASFFEPARSALIASVATGKELVAANALSAATWSVMLTLGTALGGLFMAIFHFQMAFLIDAVTFLISAALLIGMKPVFVLHKESQSSSLGEIPSGPEKQRFGIGPLIALFKNKPRLIAVCLIKTGFSLTGGVVWLLASVYGQRIFPIGKGGSLSLGLLYGAMGLGAILGSLFLKFNWVHRDRFGRLVFVLYGVRIFIFVLMFFASSLSFVAVACMLHMFTTSILWVLSSLLIQRHTPNYLQGRVFAMENATHTLSFTLLIEISGWLLDYPISIARVVFMAGLLAIFIAFVWGLLGYRFTESKDLSAQKKGD